MLKTNSKQARQNVQAYIMQGFTGENYSIETPETFKDPLDSLQAVPGFPVGLLLRRTTGKVHAS